MPGPNVKNLLLAGLPGCGKTTAVLRLVECLPDLRLAGFYTAEIRQHGTRVGFEAVGLSGGGRALLAHVRSRSRSRVGRYGVETANLARMVEKELERQAGGVDLFVVDEIGRMESLCPAFVEAVPQLLGGPVPVVATVALRGHGLVAAAKARPDVWLVKVTEGNRDGLPAEMEAWARGLVSARQGGRPD